MSLLQNTASQSEVILLWVDLLFLTTTVNRFFLPFIELAVLCFACSWAHFYFKISGHDFNSNFPWFDIALIGRWRLALNFIHTSRNLFPVADSNNCSWLSPCLSDGYWISIDELWYRLFHFFSFILWITFLLLLILLLFFEYNRINHCPLHFRVVYLLDFRIVI